MQNGVISLWQLLEACRADSAAVERAALQAARALATGASPGSMQVCLQMVAGGLHVDGVSVVVDSRVFAAVRGLSDTLAAAQIVELRLSRELTAAALTVAARRLLRRAAAEDDGAWPAGVEVVRDESLRATDEPALRLGRREPAAGPDSRLQAVFLQHRLILCLPSLRGLSPSVGKLVVQAVVDRLLSVPGGLEPLMLLQRDPARLSHGILVTVVATVFGRIVGWPDDHLAELGIAALLHDIGAVLDASNAGHAGFRWLLERGVEDLWLRAALVARGAEDENHAPVSASLVRVAEAVVDALAAGAVDVSAALAQIDDAKAAELMPVLRASFASSAA